MLAQAVVKRRDTLRCEDTGRGETRTVDIQHGAQVRRSSALVQHIGLVVEAGDGQCRFLHQGQGKCVALGQPVEQFVLIEAMHFHGGIDEITGAVKFQFAIRLPCDAPSAAIKVGGGAAVQRHLVFAGGEPQLRRREIGIGQFQRLLQLEHRVAGHQHQRDVGFNPADILIPQGGFKECNGLVLAFRHGRSP